MSAYSQAPEEPISRSRGTSNHPYVSPRTLPSAVTPGFTRSRQVGLVIVVHLRNHAKIAAWRQFPIDQSRPKRYVRVDPVSEPSAADGALSGMEIPAAPASHPRRRCPAGHPGPFGRRRGPNTATGPTGRLRRARGLRPPGFRSRIRPNPGHHDAGCSHRGDPSRNLQASARGAPRPACRRREGPSDKA